jgi:hypothetical protein
VRTHALIVGLPREPANALAASLRRVGYAARVADDDEGAARRLLERLLGRDGIDLRAMEG